MNKNYNFERQKLNLPEYGRNIKQMVEFLQTINDRELRNQQARVVVDVMGNINNHLRDTDDLKHKLWDHLFIISDFELDVDSPYPKPSPESITPQPDRLKYPTHRVSHKHYGKYIEKMLREVAALDDEEDRQVIVGNIAKYMRNKSHEYNQEHPSNEVIVNDMRIMSNNTLDIDGHILDNSRSDFRPQTGVPRQKNGKSGKNKNNGQKAGGNVRKTFKKY